ncbi:MAG TPA: sulfotransferase [Fimbriiglobus sp.]|nr:sulfotransferase [Fimbriiglobus sp.]
MPDAATKPRKPREWSPRFWEGSDFFAWLRLLWRNRFAVEPPYWYIAAIVSGVSLNNTVLRWLQHARYDDRIERTPVPHAPLFVVGHWRTGTTLLHEVLILDKQFHSPDTAQCLMPCHFLLSEEFFKRYLWFVMPERRPMDNMAAGWERPQEDEFALCLLGEPSTYTDVAFPNRPPLDPGALDLSSLSPRELVAWKRTFRRFVQALTLRDPRRLVMKSPPHTARIPVLLELFPNARFVHIKRDPYTLFASTVNLWTSMGRKHGFQTPRGGPALDEKVFREFRVIYERLFEAKPLIPAGQFFEVSYEELTADLVGTVRRVYDGLGLSGFDGVKLRLEEYAARSKGYEPNKYAITDEVRAKVKARWGDLIEKLGYGERPA